MDYCKTCVYYPPSSCDGKPCTQCDPTSAFHTCYREKEFIVDYFQQEHKPTNADRIRSMTDEELLNWINGIPSSCMDFDNESRCTLFDTCRECWLEWLKQEASND